MEKFLLFTYALFEIERDPLKRAKAIKLFPNFINSFKIKDYFHSFILALIKDEERERAGWLRSLALLSNRKPKVELDIEKAKAAPIGSFMPKPISENAARAMHLCPLHGEKTPSFTVYLKTNSWYCFGCGQGGDSIALYMKLFEKPFKLAVSELSTV